MCHSERNGSQGQSSLCVQRTWHLWERGRGKTAWLLEPEPKAMGQTRIHRGKKILLFVSDKPGTTLTVALKMICHVWRKSVYFIKRVLFLFVLLWAKLIISSSSPLFPKIFCLTFLWCSEPFFIIFLISSHCVLSPSSRVQNRWPIPTLPTLAQALGLFLCSVCGLICPFGLFLFLVICCLVRLT